MDNSKQVCPVCGHEIKTEDTWQDEYPDTETMKCPACGFEMSYMA